MGICGVRAVRLGGGGLLKGREKLLNMRLSFGERGEFLLDPVGTAGDGRVVSAAKERSDFREWALRDISEQVHRDVASEGDITRS